MFFDMVAMHVMQMPVTHVIDVTIVADGEVAAMGAMNRRMIAVLLSHIGLRHDCSTLLL